jgi:ATP-dependent Lon protease
MNRSKRILIVDDDERVGFIFRQALTSESDDWQVERARNGREALQKLERRPFDLILTDVKMPKMNGVALTEAVKNRHPETVVIWMTAFGTPSVRADAARLDVSTVLDKPVEIGEVREIVRQALDTTENPALPKNTEALTK